MAILINKKNKTISKKISDKNLVSMYLATGEWELKPKIEDSNKDKK